METPHKDFLPEQCSFEIQEVRKTLKKIDIQNYDDQNKDAIKGTKYQPYFDSTSNSVSVDDIREKLFDEETKMIILEHEMRRDCHKIDDITTDRRIIELSDNNSKMVLRRQLEMAEGEHGNMNLEKVMVDRENAEILRKLPADTIVIRQEARTNKKKGNYKEMVETNSSSGSSSTSSCPVAKVKRISRTVRNKTRDTVEIRRNPIRVSKKDVDKDFPRPRQRLLTNSKREICASYESDKRIRLSTMPYMNTRSVTRKMYTVGATYQAPTKRDETEWKEWPVHGMHERPVYHPQAGLAVEYLGRYFISLDGQSYCEIIDEPEIEVVAVDPHCNRRTSSAEKKPKGKAKAKSKCLPNSKEAWNSCLSNENKSFETCMHGSLHCVLGYCSQIMASPYNQIVEEKAETMSLQETFPAIKTASSESVIEATRFKDESTSSSVDKFAEDTKLLKGYAVAIAQNTQNKNISSTDISNRRTVASTFLSTTNCISETQTSTETENVRNTSQTSRLNLKRILRGVPNNSLILLRSSNSRMSDDLCKSTAKGSFNFAKLEDASISDETLMEMSSIYNKLISVNASGSNCGKSPAEGTLYTLNRHTTNGRTYTAKKNFLENQLEGIKTVQDMKKQNESKNTYKAKVRKLGNSIAVTNPTKNRVWCTNETSEIARILSEYNRRATRKSTIQNQINSSGLRSMKTNLTSAVPEVKKQSNTANQNVGLDLSQGKWRKFHLTLEKSKDNQINDGDRNTGNNSSMLSENHQFSLNDQQVNTLDYVRERPAEICKELNKQRRIIIADTKPEEKASISSKDQTGLLKTESLQELLENTAVLYCAANGVHQEDLSNYINTLDSKQSIQWLEGWNNSVI